MLVSHKHNDYVVEVLLGRNPFLVLDPPHNAGFSSRKIEVPSFRVEVTGQDKHFFILLNKYNNDMRPDNLVLQIHIVRHTVAAVTSDRSFESRTEKNDVPILNATLNLLYGNYRQR